MTLRCVATVALPPHRRPGGFDHASVYRGANRLYVAHTTNDSVEVIDLGRCIHEATLEGFPGVAGAAVWEQRPLLVGTCRSEGTVALAPLHDPTMITRMAIGDRPNGLAVAQRTGRALAACVGDDAVKPSFAVIVLERAGLIGSASLPGRPRWTVYDEDADLFYVNIAAPAQVLVVSATPPFQVLRSIAIPSPGPHGLDLDVGRGLLHCACDDTRAARVVETIATEKGTHTFGFDPQTEHVYALRPGASSYVPYTPEQDT